MIIQIIILHGFMKCRYDDKNKLFRYTIVVSLLRVSIFECL